MQRMSKVNFVATPDMLDIELAPFEPHMTTELVAMWRESFEHGQTSSDELNPGRGVLGSLVRKHADSRAV